MTSNMQNNITRDRYREDRAYLMILRNINNKVLSSDMGWTRLDAAGRGTDAEKHDDFLNMRTRQIFVQYVRPLDAII